MIDYDKEIGKIYGCYTILEVLPKQSGSSKRKCLCRCNVCGNTNIVDYGHLKSRLYGYCPLCRPKKQLRNNLVGKKFGSLTVIERATNHKQRNGSEKIRYKCLCDCGNICVVNACHLVDGHTKSCGCHQKKVTSQAHLKDLIGLKYGKLKVIERIYLNGKPFWRCLCDCGNEKIVNTRDLNSGKVRSCGCLISLAEAKMGEILDRLGLKYIKEYRIIGCKDKRELPFDFAIFKSGELAMLIELQGQQHYYPFTFNGEPNDIKNKNLLDRLKKDNIKSDYCKNNDIPLLIVKYTMFDKLEEIFINFYKTICDANHRL